MVTMVLIIIISLVFAIPNISPTNCASPLNSNNEFSLIFLADFGRCGNSKVQNLYCRKLVRSYTSNMLPSKGYFSGIPCIFYLSGGCPRPHCHYRHSVRDITDGRSGSSNLMDESESKEVRTDITTSWSSAQVNLVSKLVEKAVDRVLRDDSRKAGKIDRSLIVRNTLSKVLADSDTMKLAKMKQDEIDHKTEFIPYEPTPIAQLKGRHIPVICVPEKPSSSKGRSKDAKKNASVPSALPYSEERFVSSVQIPICDSRSAKFNMQNLGQRGFLNADTENSDLGDPVGQSETDSTKTIIGTNTSTNALSISQSSCMPSVAFYTRSHQSDLEFNVSSSPVREHEENTVDSVFPNVPVLFNADASITLDQFKMGSTVDLESIDYYDQSFLHSDKHKLKNDEGKTHSKQQKCHKTMKSLSLKKHKIKVVVNHAFDNLPFKCGGEIEALAKSKEQVRNPSKKRMGTDIKKENRVPTKRMKKAHEDDALLKARSQEEQGTRSDKKIPSSVKTDKSNQQNDRPKITSVEPAVSEEYTERFDGDPPNKNMKYGMTFYSNTLQVSSGLDPFTRWTKNPKLRRILGKQDEPRKVEPKSLLMKSVASLDNQSVSTEGISEPVSDPLPVPKVTPRIAHLKCDVRPVPIAFSENKITPGYRQHFCDAFFEEYKKIMSDVEQAKSRAMQDELDVAKHSGVKSYKNNCSLLLVKLRKNGCIGMNTLLEKVIKLSPCSVPDFTYGWSLYKCFSKYVLSEGDLRENGYPLALPNRADCAYIDKNFRRYSIEQPNKQFVKVCSNCSEEFEVDNIGMPTTKDDCYYHWGRLRSVRVMGQWMEKFTCCDRPGDAGPCESSTYHVWSGRDEDCMPDFVESRRLPSYMEECDSGIYALDCEMCYTTAGLELARLTVIDLNENVVFDEVVSLQNPVLDYCTRFSGIDEAKIRAATHSFEDVRRWIFEKIFDKTILIGHSLENDLKALKLIHKTVVDTSVTFPHKYGPPNKMSLKHLAHSVLKINIQENDGGHDSKEDAATCLKLMMKKIKEDSKVRKPRIIIGCSGKKR